MTENFLCPLSRKCPHIAKESLKTGMGLALKMAFILPLLNSRNIVEDRAEGTKSWETRKEGLQKVTFR